MAHDSEFRKLLESRYPSLKGQRRRAADYLLTHYRNAFALSVQELAREAKVSEATLVRFARSLGFEGYLDLRAALTEEAKQGLLPEDRFAFEEPSRLPTGTLEKVARTEVENINRTLDEIDPKSYRRFVEHLRKADLVVTMGLGVSALLSRLAAYLFFQVGVRAEPLARDVVTLLEQVEQLPKRTAVLTFAFPPYSRDTAVAAARAAERRLPVLLVTDGPRSPLVASSTVALYARTENVLYTNSVAAVSVLLNGLATELALANKLRALEQLRASDRGLKDEFL